MERRFIIALVLSGAIMFLWNVVFFPPPPPDPAAEAKKQEMAQKQKEAKPDTGANTDFGAGGFDDDAKAEAPGMLPPVQQQLEKALMDNEPEEGDVESAKPGKPMPEQDTPVAREKSVAAEGEVTNSPKGKSPELAPAPDRKPVEKAEAPKPVEAAKPAAVLEPPKEKLVQLQTEHFVATFTSVGARLKSFVLKGDKYTTEKNGETRQVDVVTVQQPEFYPFTLVMRNANFELAPDAHFDVVEQDENHVLFAYTSPQGITVQKLFELDRNYLLRFNLTVKNGASAAAIFEPKVGFASFQDDADLQKGFFGSAPMNQQIPKAYLEGEEIWEETDKEDLAAGVQQRGQILWTGIDDRYFLLALLPPDGMKSMIAAKIYSTTYTANGDELARHLLTITHLLPKQEVAPGQELTLGYQAYVGPKEYTVLVKDGYNLDAAIDFWVLGILAKPMLWIMKYTHSYIPNWGVAIIILTILIKLVLYPLTRKSYISMAKMKDLKPKIDKLKEQTGDDKAAFNQKMMDLYKKEGVNPLGGCLPMLLQLPVYIALYRMLMNSVELYNAPFIPGWLENLVMPDPYYILPVLLGVLMFVQQKLTPTPDSQQQKMMMYMMPAMMFFFMIMLPSGLVLYILANTVVSIGQTWWIQKKYQTGNATAAKA